MRKETQCYLFLITKKKNKQTPKPHIVSTKKQEGEVGQVDWLGAVGF